MGDAYQLGWTEHAEKLNSYSFISCPFMYVIEMICPMAKFNMFNDVYKQYTNNNPWKVLERD